MWPNIWSASTLASCSLLMLPLIVILMTGRPAPMPKRLDSELLMSSPSFCSSAISGASSSARVAISSTAGKIARRNASMSGGVRVSMAFWVNYRMIFWIGANRSVKFAEAIKASVMP